MRSFLGVWTLLLGPCLINSPAFATELAHPPGQVAIDVRDGGWGTARTQDIETVLRSVANVLLPYFPQRASGRIVVEHSSQGPRALFEKAADGAYHVLLNVQDTRWDQFAYQFSHELCHIFTNFEHREVGNGAATRDHQWFEETLCEAVSLFALRRMASAWERSPPHRGWGDYAPAFSEYARRLLAEQHRRLPPNVSVAQWYESNQEDLARNPYLRRKNELLATRLLPLLEETPGSLETIGYLNLEKSPPHTSFRTYLEAWYSCCPEQYRGFIRQVIALFDQRNISSSTAVAQAPSFHPVY
jgi:hypothetical protein